MHACSPQHLGELVARSAVAVQSRREARRQRRLAWAALLVLRQRLHQSLSCYETPPRQRRRLLARPGRIVARLRLLRLRGFCRRWRPGIVLPVALRICNVITLRGYFVPFCQGARATLENAITKGGQGERDEGWPEPESCWHGSATSYTCTQKVPKPRRPLLQRMIDKRSPLPSSCWKPGCPVRQPPRPGIAAQFKL